MKMLIATDSFKDALPALEVCKAIQKGIKSLSSSSVLVVAGKGHEDYQEVKGIRHHLSDIEIGTEALAA